VDKDAIDASLGLAFSLELFKRYRRSGKMQAELHRFPGIKGRSTACLSLNEGAVVSCYVEDSKGQRFPVAKDVLIRFDNEKGPFEWRFHASTSTPTHTPPPMPPPVYAGYAEVQAPRPNVPLLSDFAVPKIIASLDWKQLSTWTTRQQQILWTVWQLIDGKRTVRDIKAVVASSLSDSIVEEALHVLLELRVIIVNI
jgi:hypothetical protein